MTFPEWTLLLLVMSPWLAAAFSFALGEERPLARLISNLVFAGIAAATSVLAGVFAVAYPHKVSLGIPLLGQSFSVSLDRMGVLFAVVASILWFITIVYANGYLSHARDKARFFGFFAVCVGSAIGIALSSNLLTLFVFYEVLTLATYPLVVHNGGDAAIDGGRTYLKYALTGGALLALGVVWIYLIGGGADFSTGGVIPAALVSTDRSSLVAIFVLLIAGFGVKAALFPAHGWLPKAMVAPAPVSALLHAVAVVKAGVFGIARVMVDVFGLELSRELGVALPLALLAGFTIIFGSVKALAQDDIKKRLAYSTISQLSYIVLGLAIGTPLAAAAALAHLVHHAFLKITMFFTAGAVAEELHVYKVSQLDGAGRRMPLTMTAFTVAALGIVGVPPIAGFASKWGLGLAAIEAGEWWVVAILSVSTLLGAAYFFPMLGRIWFKPPKVEWERPAHPEGDLRMVIPLVVTATVGAVLGPMAAFAWAPGPWSAGATGALAEKVVPWFAGQFSVDGPGAAFAVLAVVVWIAAAVSAWPKPDATSARFRLFFVLAALGSIGVAFATGPAAFYTAFSVMALSSYGLIVQNSSLEAARAGRIYLAFTLVAEALLLFALLIGSAWVGPGEFTLVGSPMQSAAMVMLLVAFGIKIGVLGLHGWMPAAYGVTGAGAASAVAGVVSTAGVVGLLRFLPGGVEGLEPWGVVLMVLGLSAAFYGAVIGSLQKNPRALLGYSSISQFGLMTIGIGVGLTSSEAWPVAAAAVTAYFVHHGFAKAALFASDDLRLSLGARRGLVVLTAIPALSLAGLPLTSGAVSKVALKGAAALAPGPWAHALETLLPIAAIGTTVLVMRFVVLLFAPRTTIREDVIHKGGRVFSFVLLMVFVLGMSWLTPSPDVRHAAAKSLTGHYLLVLVWPVAAGLAISGIALLMRRTTAARVLGRVPAGDIWARPFSAIDESWLAYQSRLAQAPASKTPTERRVEEPFSMLRAIESVVLSWRFAATGILLLLLVALGLTLATM